jgi:hypothetical protein
MIGIEASLLVGFDQFEPRLIKLFERQIVAIQVIEDAELHTRPDIS